MNNSIDKSKPLGPRLLPIITVVILGSAAYFIYSDFSPVLFGETAQSIKPIETEADSDNSDSDSTTVKNGLNSNKTSASEYRKLARQIDGELQAKLRRKKESRLSTQGRDAQVQMYDRQLSERQEVFEKFKDQSEDEHSIGYGMRHEIENMKSDPPTH